MRGNSELDLLTSKGIEIYGLSKKTAKNVIRAVLSGTAAGNPEVFTAAERKEMLTPNACIFFKIVANELNPTHTMHLI